MQNTWAIRASLCLAALALVHCGDDEKKGGGTSGLNGGMLLVDMTPADARKLCEFERDLYKSGLSERAYCFRSGYPLDGSCEADLEECIASDDFENEVEDDWECESATLEDYVEGEDCQATIADYEACVRADERLQKGYYEKSSCDAPESYEGTEVVSECTALLDKCFDIS